ncbi:hypothetical protein QCA50_018076 [Cerrena zonata]|uniref:Metalloendopeptidase n=1 Tax=Cerrena zonata TaxID=2478898 RepID=A0AAW0FE86_9APHY
MQLDHISGEEDTLTECELRCILHECGHMLGFVHEHQSPARVKELTYDKKSEYNLLIVIATIRYYADTWQPELVKHNVLRIYDEEGLAAYSPFDNMSIMLYDILACMNAQHRHISRPYQLSPTDQAYATLLYPPPVTSNDAILRDALRLVGALPHQEDVIMASNGPEQFRLRFREWNAEVRAAYTKRRQLTVKCTSFLKCCANLGSRLLNIVRRPQKRLPDVIL